MKSVNPVDVSVFRFGPFELSPSRRLLSKQGRPVKVGSRALDLLTTLVERAGNVVEKDELISRVWSNVIVEDSNLRVHIAALRRILGDDRLESRYIVHAARRGYVFVAPLYRTKRPSSQPLPILVPPAGARAERTEEGIAYAPPSIHGGSI